MSPSSPFSASRGRRWRHGADCRLRDGQAGAGRDGADCHASGHTTAGATTLTPQEAQAIARDAYIYGFPIVENYKTLYAYAVDTGGPQYKAPFNEIYNTARVYTPEDTTIVTPNSDTPYSFVTMDLRAEPIVLTVAPIQEGRYFSWQTFDLYTYLAPYIGSRTTGNGGGRFLFAGPSWTGDTPEGVSMVLAAADGAWAHRRPHAALRSGRSRQRDQGPGRLHGRAAEPRSSARRLHPRPRPSTGCRTTTRRRRGSASSTT